jgi:DNA-binding MurR/RpiR family transcriptional regulator
MIEQRLPALSGASRRVAETIVSDPWAILGMTIYDVAGASGVSLPSVTRFCRVVGYPGFRELVQGIAQSLGRINAKDLEALEAPSDAGGLESLATSIVSRQIDALQTTLRTLDFAAIEQMVEAIAKAQRVSVVGHGGAYVSALGLGFKLNWAGIPAFPATPDLFSNQIIAVGPDDVVIGVSHQGRTRDTIEMLRLARSFGATTIGVTIVGQSPLSEVADISVAVLSPDVLRAGTFLIAYNAVMVLADVLAAAVTERRWGGIPPHRDQAVEWIETNLRVGPVMDSAARRRATRQRPRRTNRREEGTRG